MSSDIVASHHKRQARATRAKKTTSGVSHSFSVPNYLPDLNRPACGHRPLSASRARAKRGCERAIRGHYDDVMSIVLTNGESSKEDVEIYYKNF